MENKVQAKIQPVQPAPQAPSIFPPSANLFKILLYIVFGLIVVAGSVFIGIEIGKNQSANQQPITVPPTVPPTKTDQLTIIGVIRTSGLSEDEKQKLGLSGVAYQITDFNKNEKQDLYGYYLLSGDIETYLGKCVQITGTEPIEGKTENKKDPYQRAALVLDSINSVDSTKCNPYSPSLDENVEEANKLTLRGIVDYSNRPAPDIGYDYKIKLSKPYLDEYSPSGSSQEVNIIEAVPGSNDVWIALNNNINREVEIQGYMEWGYAESKYFKIISIISLQ